jgi:hypothetical protein
VERVRGQYGRKAIALLIRMVRRRFAHADADRAHDPHPTHPVHSEPGGYACYLINCQHYGVRHLPAVLTDRSAFGDGAVAAGVFRLAGWNFVELLLSYATGENGLHPPLWTVVVMS